MNITHVEDKIKAFSIASFQRTKV